MKCPNCGRELSSDTIFCNGCGTKVGETEDVTTRVLSTDSPTESESFDPSVLGILEVATNGAEIQIDSKEKIIGRRLIEESARSPIHIGYYEEISKEHFKITREGNEFYIEDLGSKNGTIVNGEDIGGKGKIKLIADAEIIISRMRAIFRIV